ncbi:MAG TPA: AAC(3) family N-acetyltransferase [Chthoniobacteraceae bacterium]|nr:AAC(3) family N-acetyltransferase [Chthoniobacteraceae bacterium]
MIDQHQLREGFSRLGIRPGDLLLVHSALSSLGTVRGGADAVIDALLEAVGPGGTLMMPALSSDVFDPARSPSKVGLLTETFRGREGVLRSFHPSHSVTALGARAAEMVAGHLECPTACGEGTPYAKLMEAGGKILLLGVDQDRNTSLHGLEAMARLPFLKTVTRDYIDPCDGTVRSLEITLYPGPHRNFIGLDRRLREAGAMAVAKVGRAVCRLIDAREMRDLLLPELRRDPTVILCDNPHCRDCIAQRACVKRQRLESEDFLLSVVSNAAGHRLEEILATIEAEGVRHLELREINGREVIDFSDTELATLRSTLETKGIGITAVSSRRAMVDAGRLVETAVQLGAPAVVLPFGPSARAAAERAASAKLRLHLENRNESASDCQEHLQAIRESGALLAFNPARFAATGEKPFLKVYSKTPLRRWVGQLRFADGTFDGRPTLPGYGNGEVLELLSILRCASFDGPIVLDATPEFPFQQMMKAFWDALERI